MSKAFEKKLKSILYIILSKIFKRQKVVINKSLIKKILIVRQDNRVGNLVMLTPLIEKTKELFHEATIDLVIGYKFSNVLSNNPNVNQIFLYSQPVFVKNPFEWFKFIKNLRSIKYDLVIDASHPHSFSLSDALISNLVNPKFVIGFQRDKGNDFYNFKVKPNLEIHNSQALLQLLECIGYKSQEFVYPKLYLNAENENFAYDYFEKNNLFSFKVIAIFPGAKKEKNWGIDNFINLHKSIIKSNSNIRIIWILGPDEQDYIENIDKLENSCIISDINILNIAAIIKRCSAFISGDTGPMHVSVAVNTPTLQIFLQTTINRFGYQGNNHFIFNGNYPNDVIYMIGQKIKKL